MRQPNADVLVHRNVDAGNACHVLSSFRLALTLLVASVGTNDIDHAATAHDLAVLADLLDGWTYFHR
jgi:hypothetical protein